MIGSPDLAAHTPRPDPAAITAALGDQTHGTAGWSVPDAVGDQVRDRTRQLIAIPGHGEPRRCRR
jgi:hypothetical protein